MNLCISFSGGETSAFMTHYILNSTEFINKYENIEVVFANTGQENEATLEFVKNCDDQFNFNTTWIEAKVFHNQRKSNGAKVVSFETASRMGEPFEEDIKKYGISNQAFKGCSKSLKRYPIENYLIDMFGWARNSYDLAIGIRVDEIDRMSEAARERRIIYPLINPLRVTKPNINSWWAKQNFRLKLKGYQGNCKWCWKKSDRKLFTIMSENPEAFEFPNRMEEMYGEIGAEFRKAEARKRPPLPEGYRRVFFRGNRSVNDLRNDFLKVHNTFKPADDDSIVFDPDLDVGGGCEETCEVY